MTYYVWKEKLASGHKRQLCSHLYTSVGGVKVSMVAFQAVDPGSIPGRRIFCNFYQKQMDIMTRLGCRLRPGKTCFSNANAIVIDFCTEVATFRKRGESFLLCAQQLYDGNTLNTIL